MLHENHSKPTLPASSIVQQKVKFIGEQKTTSLPELMLKKYL
jgi:hypothetical protein